MQYNARSSLKPQRSTSVIEVVQASMLQSEQPQRSITIQSEQTRRSTTTHGAASNLDAVQASSQYKRRCFNRSSLDAASNPDAVQQFSQSRLDAVQRPTSPHPSGLNFLAGGVLQAPTRADSIS